MKCLVLFAVSAVLLALFPGAEAQMLDVFRIRDDVSEIPAAPLLRGIPCQPRPDARPLELDDAILQAICAHPQARGAWAEARAQAAALAVATAAYLPTLNATAGLQRNTLSSTYDYSGLGVGSIRHSQNTSSKYGVLNLSWVLFDFGKRGTALRQARALLAAANATQDDTLQTVFFNTAQAFYALRDAQASLGAAQRSAPKQSRVKALRKRARGTKQAQVRSLTNYRRAQVTGVLCSIASVQKVTHA